MDATAIEQDKNTVKEIVFKLYETEPDSAKELVDELMTVTHAC